MDNNESSSSHGGEIEKKGPFDNLDRDELIKKCKGLLVIAQKAKKAKDDYANEVIVLKEQITQFDTQKHADKECLKAMQEMVESLTEYKLTSANKIADSERKENLLNAKVVEYENQIRSFAEVSIEREALQRQVKRLTEENEEQASDLDQMNGKLQHVTKMSELQNSQLIELEKSVDHWKEVETKYKQLVGEFEALQKKWDENQLESEQTVDVTQLDDENKALKDSLNQTTLNLENTKKDLDRVLNELSALKEESGTSAKQADSNKDQFVRENEKLKQQISNQMNRLSKYKSKLVEFSTKLKQLKNIKEILLGTVTEYSDAITKWRSDIVLGSQQLFDKLHELEQKNLSLDEQLKESKSTIQNEITEKNDKLSAMNEIEAKYEDLLKQFEDSTKRINGQNEMIETLKSNAVDSEKKLGVLVLEKNKFSDSIETLQTDNRKLKEKIENLTLNIENTNKSNATFSEYLENEKAALKQQIKNLEAKISDLKADVDTKVLEIKDAYEKIETKSKQNDDLLMEMRELNEALKNRGDVISKQNAELSSLQQMVQNDTGRINELDSDLKEKNKLIEQLTNSLTKYEKSEQESSVTDTQSEILSTSTISRVEEVARMRDIEDSFEEKYNKLRGLAIKLKKKVAEQQQTIAKLEANAASSSSADGTNVKIQNLKSLQSENDRLMDSIESLTTENRQLIKEVSELKEQLEARVSELATNDASGYKTKSALDETLIKCRKDNEALTEENNKLKIKQKDQENELIRLNDELKAKKIEVESKIEGEKKLKSVLSKIKSSVKKNNVLNLEMEAYEKSLNEISQKLESKKLQLAEMESANKMLESTIDTLKNELKLIEESLRAEKQHSIDLKQETDMQQIKLKESEHERSELKIKVDEITTELNGIKLELADSRTEHSQYTVENQKLISTLENENERNTRKIFAMGDEIRTLKATLNETNQELVTVQTEFASYKVRAQSVLRQNQSKDSSSEDDLKEELATVTKAKEALSAKLNTHVEQFKYLQNQCEQLKCDKENLQTRCKELLQLLDESRHQIDLIHEENRKQMHEQREALKVQRLQIDTLNACYKKQIAELEEKHEVELNVWKSKNKTVEVENKEAIGKSKTEQMSVLDEQHIDWIMMERQAGEGSENTGSLHNVPHRKTSSVRNKHDLMPLDELLNTSFDDIEPSIIEEHSISPSIELQSTKEKLLIQQSHVKHLATLLSEAELDVARLTQLNDVLKEELRRHERSTEREMHMHNLEYIKNVIFKFLTINNADERAHLVPVLNTILKLSPDELHRLQAVAKGGDPSHSGWISILPIW